MAAKGPIYREKDVVANVELLNQLSEAVSELESKMKASISISRGMTGAGFGVNKAQRGIAADAVISIAKAIKALKGW